MENEKKWLSEASDEWKTGKNGFPRPRMSGKLEKMAFRDLRNAKNAEKCVSNPSESQKCRKTLVVGRRNAKNAEKCSSSVDETQKSPKNARVGRRNAENAENRVS